MRRSLPSGALPHICSFCRARLSNAARLDRQAGRSALSTAAPLQRGQDWRGAPHTAKGTRLNEMIGVQPRPEQHLPWSTDQESLGRGSNDKARGPSTSTSAAERRVEMLGGFEKMPYFYPRWSSADPIPSLSATAFAAYADSPHAKSNDEPHSELPLMRIFGRLKRVRQHGSSLIFLDLQTRGSETAQVMLNAAAVFDDRTQGVDAFKHLVRTSQRGDWLSVVGRPGKSSSGQWNLTAKEMPRIEAPTIQTLPLQIKDPEVRMRHRHVDMLLDSSLQDVFVLRSKIIAAIRSFLDSKDFVEVSTPLLVAGASGATARPFETTATEFPGTKLNLRVAPELWLKRLIVGGLDRVYELGPAFRNEGVDATHNPEFTICEFYAAMTDIEQLMTMTEALFAALERVARAARPAAADFPPFAAGAPFPRLDFIPALEDAVRAAVPDWSCPDLDAPDATHALLDLYAQLPFQLPAAPTLPRLLDDLAARLLEPKCVGPTFISHHPACLAPLAKSFRRPRRAADPATPRDRVAARAELFVAGRELVNCYEEENSPFEQRRKMARQLALRRAPDGAVDAEVPDDLDESYLAALEWGLPPTGGWGCGVDRIVMLFAGRARIADVLPFGTLRNVVALGSTAGSGQGPRRQ